MEQRAPHDVLSECLERLEQGRDGVEDLLAQHPELREELEALLDLALELRAMPRLRAPERLRRDPAWRRGLTSSPVDLPLWAAARAEQRPPSGRPERPAARRLRGTLGRLAAGAGGAGLALLLAGSLATSTATSLPDEPLYPVKRLVEDAQLAIAPPEARLELRLHRAQERMKETREMIERDRADVVASLATEYVREVDAVRQELENARARAPEPEQVGRVLTRLEANEQMLGAIVERVPEPARPAVARAVEVSRPERIAPPEVPVQRTVPPPAEPPAVVPPAAAPPAVAPPGAAVAPRFGSAAPTSETVPEKAPVAEPRPEPASVLPAPSKPTEPAVPRVSAPSVAPALLPTSGPSSPAAPAATPAPTATGASAPGPAARPAAASPAPALGAPAAPALGAPTTAPTAGTQRGYTILPPVSAAPKPTDAVPLAAPATNAPH